MVKHKVILLLIATLFPLSSQARGYEIPVKANDYAVHPGMTIEACGGLVGDCRIFTLEGSLRLGVDFSTGTAEIVASDLRLRQGEVAFPFPNPEDLPLTDLIGTLGAMKVGENPRIRFESPPGSQQQVAWTLNLTENEFVLNGTYDEGCCDRFIYHFVNVVFTALAGPSQETLLLGEGRFAVEVDWRDFHGTAGTGKALALTADSGYFWFFGEDNIELVVKVLNACQDPFRHFWVFAAGLTNVEVTLTVTDLEADVTRTYTNPLGTSFQPVLDTSAFATCDF